MTVSRRRMWSGMSIPPVPPNRMRTDLNTRIVTRRCHHLTVVIGCAAMLIGCAERHDDGVLASMRRTRAMLTAARAGRVSMFGDHPQAHDSTYFTRAVVSLRQHTFTEVGADFEPDVDSTGQRIVFASTSHSGRSDLYIKSVDGVAVTVLTSDPASDVQPAFSPDGTRVAFASNRSGNWDIWIIGVEGSPPVQVTTGIGDEVHPTWSPDGRRLVFCSRLPDRGQWELWIADATAGASKRFIGYGLFPEWSPVGDVIVYQRARERGRRWFSIWTLTLVDGEPRYPTEVASSTALAMISPSWSPDGTRIVFVSAAELPSEFDNTKWPETNSVFDIWVMNASGHGKVRLTDGHTGNYSPVFSTDGRVFFTSNRSGHENIWSLLPAPQPVAASRENRVTELEVKTQETVRKASFNDDL